MMSSTPRKRPKLKPKPNVKPSPPHSDSSLKSLIEPPHNLFPSRDEFLRLMSVLAIATIVALACNFLATSFINRQSKPFCDNRDLDSPDSVSGESLIFFNLLFFSALEKLEGKEKITKNSLNDVSLDMLVSEPDLHALWLVG